MAISYSVFQYVSDSLKDHISTILDPTITVPTGYENPIDDNANVALNDIVFDSPFDMIEGATNRLSVYLYSIKPNIEQRNNPPEVVYTDAFKTDVKLQRFNLTMDLYYMITPFGTSRRNEYAILERIVQILNINATLSGAMLKGTLPDNNNTEIRVEPLSLSLDEVNKLWSIFPNKSHKLSLFYQLTPVNVTSAKIAEDLKTAVDKKIDPKQYKPA